MKLEASAAALIRPDATASAFKVIGRNNLVVKAGTVFAGHTFAEDIDVKPDLDPGYIPGADYIVRFDGADLSVSRPTGIPEGETLLGGFHYAPGGNAPSRSGGDDVPAINPYSLWDVGFRPACPDPRGMTLVEAPGGCFWCDIYLTGTNHLADGTSKFGATIADGTDLPRDSNGSPVRRFDYEAAKAAMAAHGKGLLGVDEFFAAAFGVTEKTAAPRDPVTTGLDALRTSRFGLMQATGNMWAWGHDADPDMPRPSFFGGSWLNDEDAGSRCADLGAWPDDSVVNIGARGRSDHLQLG
ncbi:MAG: hypothetical protein WDM91_11180 [Rhizomicrobium sp.]